METAVNILLVDDDPRNLDALEVILAGGQYRFIRALTGDAALSALLANDVAAIVLDIRMPDVNGVELAGMIKGTKRFREIPILFLTAHLLEESDVVAGYGAGAVDYLVKPLNPLVLKQKIGVFADLFRKTRALAELNETLEARVRERTAELEKSEAALRAADKQKDEFLATLAHELRNPLAPLRMGLDLLQRDNVETRSGTLPVMKRQLDHMVRLIDDLLDVARISGGKLELKKETVSVAEAIQTALDTSRPFVEEKRQVVSVEKDDSVVAFADLTRLAQIVGNLLHNASKFTAEEGRITVKLSYEPPLAVISVSDSGVGIAADELPRVFEMFTRVDRSSGVNTGLGIGLALSRRLAQMHDGDIAVTSPGRGRGSTFTLSFPAEVTDVAVPATRSEQAFRLPKPIGEKPVNVLIIEDNEDAAEMMAIALAGQGYATSVAHDGLSGLGLIEAQCPQIVLCDIGLPKIDGIAVCRRVRQLALGYTPVMIAVSGWGMEEDVRLSAEAGFDHHLIKPVEPEALFRLLETFIEPAPQTLNTDLTPGFRTARKQES